MNFGVFSNGNGILAAATKDVVAKFHDGRFRTGAPPLCLQTRRASPLLPPSLFLLSFGRLPLPLRVPLGLASLSASLPSAPPERLPRVPFSLFLALLSSRPRLPVERKEAAESHHVVPPHHRPLPARPLRFKSPSGGEDVNFTAWEHERRRCPQPRNGKRVSAKFAMGIPRKGP